MNFHMIAYTTRKGPSFGSNAVVSHFRSFQSIPKLPRVINPTTRSLVSLVPSPHPCRDDRFSVETSGEPLEQTKKITDVSASR